MNKPELLQKLLYDWKERLKKQNLTIREFCDKINISYGYYCNMTNPTIKLLDKIESAIKEIEEST